MNKRRLISIICLSILTVICIVIFNNHSNLSSVAPVSPTEGLYELKLSKKNADTTHFQILYYSEDQWNVLEEFYPKTDGKYKFRILDADFLTIEIEDENNNVIWDCSLEGIKENTNSLGYKFILPNDVDLVEGCYEILYSSVSSSVQRQYQTDKTYFDPYKNITDGVAVVIWG